MQTKKIFLASSCELKEDRQAFEIFINRKNNHWVTKGVFLKLIVWEDFLDTLSKTRLQDEYNQAIKTCDLFVMLFSTKVGKYTEEEFETAVGQFQTTNKPFIFTYFKETHISTGSVNQQDLKSLWAFQEKLKKLGHFQTHYANSDGLNLHFYQQLDKLVANGFIEFDTNMGEAVASSGDTYHAELIGDGVIAQGTGTIAVGAGGVSVGGNNSGNINTGKQTNINTGGGAYVGGSVVTGRDFIGRDNIDHGISSEEIKALFDALQSVISKQTSGDTQAVAMQQVKALKAEVAKGEQADDSKMAKIVEGLMEKVPGAIGTVVNMFATPILGGLVGPVTKFVLNKLKSSQGMEIE